MNLLLSPLKLHILNIALRQNSMPSLINIIKFLTNQRKNWWISENKIIKNQNILKKNWLLSTQKHHASQKLLKWSIKYQSSFHHNYLLLKLLHTLTRILISLVWTTASKQKKLNLNQHLKRLIIRSKIITWKVSSMLPWIYQLSHKISFEM